MEIPFAAHVDQGLIDLLCGSAGRWCANQRGSRGVPGRLESVCVVCLPHVRIHRVSSSPELESPEPTGWWSRPCGGREVLAIALPLVVQSCFWSVMWFIDRLYLSWYSPEAT